jgi:hypothetical protein
MALTPVAPSISALTANGFTISVNPDGNPAPPLTYYTFRVITGLGIFYVNALGVLQATKVFLPVLSITVINAVPNTLHTISLTAADDAIGTNESVNGPVITATTLAAQPITASFANVFSTTVMANWLANANPTGTEYEVELATDPSFLTGVVTSGFVTTVGYVFTNLIPSITYYGRVKARNSVLAVTSLTSLGSVNTATGPDTVKAIRVFNLLAERGYLITWQPNQETNIANYRVYRSESPTDIVNFQKIGETATPVLSVLDRVPFTFGIVFYYSVTAVDDGGNESSLLLTTPVHENTYHSFEEQPFPNSISPLDFVTDETPIGVIDTVNTLFITLAPYRKGSVEVYLNGVKMLPGVHFNEGPLSQQITFTDPPDLGGFIRVNYKKFGI